MSVAPAPGTCCRQSWGKAELATRGAAEEGLEMVVAALERGQMKQPRLDLPASVVMVVRIAVVRNTGPVAVVVVLPRAKAPAAWAAVVVTVVVVVVFLEGRCGQCPLQPWW